MVDSDIAPLMHKLCMVEGEHFVAFSRANIATRIKAVLHPDMREEINRIRKNGHDLVRRAHTTTTVGRSDSDKGRHRHTTRWRAGRAALARVSGCVCSMWSEVR